MIHHIIIIDSNLSCQMFPKKCICMQPTQPHNHFCFVFLRFFVCFFYFYFFFTFFFQFFYSFFHRFLFVFLFLCFVFFLLFLFLHVCDAFAWLVRCVLFFFCFKIQTHTHTHTKKITKPTAKQTQ